jgi:hypothetical protein
MMREGGASFQRACGLLQNSQTLSLLFHGSAGQKSGMVLP